MNLEKHIFNLLQQHDCVIVPEFGGFIANFEPASIEPATHAISPPRKYLVFNSGLTINDGLLATEVQSRLGCSFTEAMQNIRLEVEGWNETLASGKMLVLEGIGALQLNKSGKTEFKPEPGQNFFNDAFGLTTIVFPPLQKRNRKAKPIRQVYHKPAHKATMRVIRRVAWAAAISIPLVSAGIWSALNFDTLRQYTHQYSGFVIPVRTQSPASVNEIYFPEPYIFQPSLEALKLPDDAFDYPDDSLTDDTVTELTEVANPEFEEITALNNLLPDCEPVSATGRAYYIIVGSFESEENARLLNDELLLQGWQPKVIDSNQGMFRVSIASCADKQKALQELTKIREQSNPGAWLLRI